MLKPFFATFAILISASLAFSSDLFDMEEIRDPSTLDTKVIKDWHPVAGKVATRQKVMEIHVGEIWPGQDIRIPLRLVVPAEEKATGFHLTGGSNHDRITSDLKVGGVDGTLIENGIGIVHTVVQSPGRNTSEILKIVQESEARFIRDLDARVKIQYWAWPAILMRAITAAEAETEYFNKGGKVVVTGSSKNGASPSMAIIHDDRMTAVHASVSPIWDSPIRLADRDAWEAAGGPFKNRFLGGHFGPSYTEQALEAGHSWEDIAKLNTELADATFVSRNWERLTERGAEFYFHPGSHDSVCYDVVWGGEHHPQIPVYFGANSGHGMREKHPGNRPTGNKSAFILRHFFPDAIAPLLAPPDVTYSVEGDKLHYQVIFPKDARSEDGMAFWMFDRPIEGSEGYLKEPFPEDTYVKMEKKGNTYHATISIKSGAKHIDIFSHHNKTLNFKGQRHTNTVNAPYQRIELGRSE